MGRVIHRSCIIGILLEFFLVPLCVRAETPQSPADAYRSALALERQGDPRQAAENYERADELSPTPQALRSAARTRFDAGDYARAANHAESLLKRYGDDAKSRELGHKILSRVEARVTRLQVRCTKRCSLKYIEGRGPSGNRQLNHTVYLEPGRYVLQAKFARNVSSPSSLAAKAGEVLSLALAPGENRSSSTARVLQSVERSTNGTSRDNPAVQQISRQRGWSPAVFIASVVATSALGAVTIWSGLETEKTKDAFLENETGALYDEGIKQQRRTNILIGATSATALASLAIGVFATDWGLWSRNESRSGASGLPRMSIAASARSAQLQVGGVF